MSTSDGPVRRPLDGVRVIEAASYVSGPFAGLMLADLGAEVIKVEPPPAGDPFRTFGQRVNGHSVLFANINRGKRSVLLDLADDAGRRQFAELLSSADILITNWRPGVAERLGMTAESLREEHPRLVWIRISGYGQDGPASSLPVFDSLIQARTGLAALQRGGSPRLVPGYLADKLSAGFAVQTALAALHDRERSGEGALIDLAMLDVMAYFNFPDLLVDHTVVGNDATGSAQATAVRPVATRDGWIVVNPVRGRHIADAFRAVGHPEWIEQVKLIADPSKVAETIYDLLETVTPQRTSAEWERLFAENDVPCSSVLDVAAHLQDAQVLHNRVYLELNDPALGDLRRVRYPAIFDSMPETEPGRAHPLSGEMDPPERNPSSAPGVS